MATTSENQARCSRSSRPFTCKEAWAKVIKTTKDAHVLLDQLSGKEETRIRIAVSTLKEKQKTTRRKGYKIFLFELLKCNNGNTLVALCSVAIGQQVIDMTKRERDELLHKFRDIGNSDAIASSIFHSLAIRFNISNPTHGKSSKLCY